MSQTESALVRGHRAALWLCPPAFRHRFGDELAQDFEDGLGDARASGRARDVASFVLRIAKDVLTTAAVQWMRAGVALPAALTILAALALAVATARVRLARGWTDAVRPQDEDVMTLFLMIGVVLLVVVATIFFTLALLRPRRARRRG